METMRSGGPAECGFTITSNNHHLVHGLRRCALERASTRLAWCGVDDLFWIGLILAAACERLSDTHLFVFTRWSISLLFFRWPDIKRKSGSTYRIVAVEPN